MVLFYGIMNFIYGISIGSFLGVVGMRIPRGQSITEPKRSYCEKCERTLKWHELIPLMSWLVQGGKCKGCKGEIPATYPLIELYTGVGFVCVYLGMESNVLLGYIAAYIGVITFVLFYLFNEYSKRFPGGIIIALSLVYLVTLFFA